MCRGHFRSAVVLGSTAAWRCLKRSNLKNDFRVSLRRKRKLPLLTSAGEEQDVYPGRGRFYPTKPSPGRPGGDVPRLLGEREALGAPEGVHPAEHQRLPAAAARPAARPVHGVGEQRLPRLSVRKHSVLSTVVTVQHEYELIEQAFVETKNLSQPLKLLLTGMFTAC